jgi:hypothetical protein
MAKRPVNEILTKKVEWFLFIVIFCSAPYLLRVVFSFTYDELDKFYISEVDVFFYCIAVMAALFADIKKLKKIPYNLGEGVFYCCLTLYIVGLFFGVWFSFDFEHQIITLREQCFDHLQDKLNIDEIFKKVEEYETKKFKLFLASMPVAIITTILSYKVLFKVNG